MFGIKANRLLIIFLHSNNNCRVIRMKTCLHFFFEMAFGINLRRRRKKCLLCGGEQRENFSNELLLERFGSNPGSLAILVTLSRVVFSLIEMPSVGNRITRKVIKIRYSLLHVFHQFPLVLQASATRHRITSRA